MAFDMLHWEGRDGDGHGDVTNTALTCLQMSGRIRASVAKPASNWLACQLFPETLNSALVATW